MFARCEADIVRCSLCTKKFLELLGKLFCDAISASALCSRSDLLMKKFSIAPSTSQPT